MDLYKLPETKIRALFLRQAYFFTGIKCKRGHLSARYASSSNCIQCIEEKRGIVFSNKRNNKNMRSPENQKLAMEAWERGDSYFIAANPCNKGHYRRYVTTNNCIECNAKATENRKNKIKWARILKVYNLSEDDFLLIKQKQESKCAICANALNDKNQHIDHCHSTNKIRGILCSKCNQGIGLFGESLVKLQKAIDYLKVNNVNS